MGFMKRRESSRERGRQRLSARSDQGVPGWVSLAECSLRSGSKHKWSLSAPISILSCSISIWRVCSREKSGVHTGERPMKQLTHRNNSSFFNSSIQHALLWTSNFWGLPLSFEEKDGRQAVCQTNLNFPHGSQKSKMLNPGLLMCCMTRWRGGKRKEKKEIHFLRRHI